jgi:hypothetical protein
MLQTEPKKSLKIGMVVSRVSVGASERRNLETHCLGHWYVIQSLQQVSYLDLTRDKIYLENNIRAKAGPK